MKNKILFFLVCAMLSVNVFAQEQSDKKEESLDERIDKAFGDYTGWFVGAIFSKIDISGDTYTFQSISSDKNDTQTQGEVNLSTSLDDYNKDSVVLNIQVATEANAQYKFHLTDDLSVYSEIRENEPAKLSFTVPKGGQYTLEMTEVTRIPWVLVVLLLGAVAFTIYFKFINVTGFLTAIRIVQGKYDHLEENGHIEASETVHVSEDGDEIDTIRVEGHDGEVSHFQALTAALSATVGLGNIAGVAVALSIGGPGATFWMIIAGLIGMASKFTECTLGVKYREIDESGKVFGGPMYYLKKGLADKKMKFLGSVLAVLFAIMCIGGSFGGGNMFQANQAFSMMEKISLSKFESIEHLKAEAGSSITIDVKGKNVSAKIVSVDDQNTNVVINNEEQQMSNAVILEKAKISPLTGSGWLVGIIMAVLVGIVIIGGIKSIANVTDKIVPFMVVIYVLAALIILGMNASMIPEAFGQIFSGAFTGAGIVGGVVGVLIQGFKRAAFSNEAGIGSASIAHSAVKTKNPASEGLVALLEPFIDTVLVCTMTALVLIITNMNGEIFTYGQEVAEGVAITSKAFASEFSWFPYILTVAVVLFAFSSMISWSYYGYQAWSFLFGKSEKIGYIYKALFCLFVIVGCSAKLGAVINFSDAMIFAMLVPNMIGLFILMPVVKRELTSFMGKIKNS